MCRFFFCQRERRSVFSPPENDSFFCFRRVISELRGPIAAKFCTMFLSMFNFIIPVQNFGGASPKKFYMRNLARFRSTSKFGGEYLRNGWRYSKSVSYSFDSDSSRVRRNKSGEDRSSNLGDLDVELNPPKVHFSENHILAPRGCCAPKLLHALELSLIHIWRCRRSYACRSRWSPYH